MAFVLHGVMPRRFRHRKRSFRGLNNQISEPGVKTTTILLVDDNAVVRRGL